MTDRLSPGSGGPLIDPDGNAWTMVRRRLDPRVLRRAFEHTDRLLLLGEDGGFTLRWVTRAQRASLWQKMCTDGDFIGCEFANADGDRLSYIELWC